MERGAEVVRDPSVGSLAAIVDGGLRMIAGRHARAALVLMSDLPLLQPDDVRGLIASLGRTPRMNTSAAIGR